MYKNRNAFTVIDDTEAITFIKPFSGEYNEQLIVVREDAFGEIKMEILSFSKIMKERHLSSKDFNLMLDELNK